MTYRNGTYIAFHANGMTEPTESDMKYYRLLTAWDARDADGFRFVDSHEKTRALTDASTRRAVERSLKARLDNSKNMVLIIGATTWQDRDWVPLEIRYAIDECAIPIIAAYTGYTRVQDPVALAPLWPTALQERISDGSAHVIHVPFKKLPLQDAISTFSHVNYPLGGGLGVYHANAYASWGL
jgi:hypothetical protein